MNKRRRSSSGAQYFGNSQSQGFQAYPPPMKNFRGRSYRRGYRKAAASYAANPKHPLSGSLEKVYTYRQQVYTTTITQTAGAITAGAINMTAGQLPQIATFNSLYDAYRIDYMEVTFRCRFPNNDLENGANLVVPPLIYVAIDKDDSTVPTLAQIIEYQGLETHPSTDAVFTLRWKPATRGMVWDGAAAQAGVRQNAPWIDAAQTGIPHYGLKYVVTAGTAAATYLQVWDVELQCGISFKNVR